MALGVAPCTKHEDCRLHADLAIACAIQEAGLLPQPGRPCLIALGEMQLDSRQHRRLVVRPPQGMHSPRLCLPRQIAESLCLYDIRCNGAMVFEQAHGSVQWDYGATSYFPRLSGDLFLPDNDLVLPDIRPGGQLEFTIVNNSSTSSIRFDGAVVRGFHMR